MFLTPEVSGVAKRELGFKTPLAFKMVALHKLFESSNDQFDLKKHVIVVDGGFLLHKVPWPKGSTVLSINSVQQLHQVHYKTLLRSELHSCF